MALPSFIWVKNKANWLTIRRCFNKFDLTFYLIVYWFFKADI